MQTLLKRYRDLTVLVLVLVSQLLLLAYQVRGRQDGYALRNWAVTGVMPMARVAEAIRDNTIGLLREYFVLLDVKEQNRRLKKELGSVKMENQFLKSELGTADRARALAAFQGRTPSRTVAARLLGAGIGSNSKTVFVDRGSSAGVAKGMAVVTPDGIVGKVTAAYTSASQVMLITDPAFAAGVLSQTSRVQGTLKGQGHTTCLVDYIQNEEKVQDGEWFYTSGDDRIFPKGMPVGRVKSASSGRLFKEVILVPSGLQGGLEEVLIVLEGVHQLIPENADPSQPLHLLPPPPADPSHARQSDLGVGGTLTTDADQIVERYRRIGAAQGHSFGRGGVPNFNIVPPSPAPAAPAGGTPASPRPESAPQ